jgi:hypothetical protein
MEIGVAIAAYANAVVAADGTMRGFPSNEPLQRRPLPLLAGSGKFRTYFLLNAQTNVTRHDALRERKHNNNITSVDKY